MPEVAKEWSDMPLDSRIVEALHDLNWKQPTTVQGACIPLALKGKDLSIQAYTGSGKSGAFVIPLIQRIISERQQTAAMGSSFTPSPFPTALILVVSAELSTQATEVVESLVKYVKPPVTVDNLFMRGSITSARLTSSQVIVAPAAVLAKAFSKGVATSATFAGLKYLVVDEADMLVSVAEMSLRTIQSFLPDVLQVVLASATLSEELLSMKGKLLHKPTNVVLTEEKRTTNDGLVGTVSHESGSSALISGESQNNVMVESRVALSNAALASALHQYYLVATDECHRHTLLFALFRLRLIDGKTLIFVNDDEDTYHLQHFLEQLGIATLLYDPTLPINVRLHTLKRFQTGEVNVMVCTDGTLESAEQLRSSMRATEEAEGVAAEESSPRRRKREGKRKSMEDASSSLHRGVDFHKVRNIIIFDGVDSTSSISLSRYTHRIGRAGRAGEEGLSIVFFTVTQAKKFITPLRSYCESKGHSIAPFKQMYRSEAAKLQYRVDSVLENVTRAATRRLKVASVAAELSRSSYLANHFTDKDSEALKRVLDRSKKTVKIERNLLHIPEYLDIKGAENAERFTRRVRADKTRDHAYKVLTKKAPVDPVKVAMSKIRASRKK